MSSKNMTNACRELWEPGVVEQVFTAIPLFAALLMARRIKVRGGSSIKKTVDYDEMDDLAQEYAGANEQLTSAKKDFLDSASFKWKKFQVPIEYDEEEESEARGGTDVSPVDLVEVKVRKGLRAAKIKLYKMMYDKPSATSDTDKGFQGLADALKHDYTYGGLTRATTVTNSWWQGASIAGSFADNGTAYTASIATFRNAFNAISINVEKVTDALAVCGSVIFERLRSQIEASGLNTNLGKTPLGKYGFTAIEIDGIEVVRDPFLDKKVWGAGANEDTSKWFFMLNKPDWELRLFPGRDLSVMTPFKHQGENINGYDKYLARVYVKGNLVCWKPNGSIWLSNVA